MRDASQTVKASHRYKPTERPGALTSAPKGRTRARACLLRTSATLVGKLSGSWSISQDDGAQTAEEQPEQ